MIVFLLKTETKRQMGRKLKKRFDSLSAFCGGAVRPGEIAPLQRADSIPNSTQGFSLDYYV